MMTPELRQELVDCIRDLALNDDNVAEIMHKILDTEPIDEFTEDPNLAAPMMLFAELWCNAEDVIICEVVK